MKIINVSATAAHGKVKENPNSDALQILSPPGSVTVKVQSDDGTEGVGTCSFGRIAGAPEALVAMVEHELKPIVLGPLGTVLERPWACRVGGCGVATAGRSRHTPWWAGSTTTMTRYRESVPRR